MLCIFFFQAEDGIRDYKVTGVQTCALPICETVQLHVHERRCQPPLTVGASAAIVRGRPLDLRDSSLVQRQIGRASCRERGLNSEGAESLKQQNTRAENEDDY